MNERDQRRRAVHFVDSWNHYFFHPRRLTVVLARGRRIYSGTSDNHSHRRRSTGDERGRDIDPSHSKGRLYRSHSTDSSSSSSSSSSSDSSIHSTASDPHEIPVPHTQTGYGSENGFGGPVPGVGRGRGWGGRRFGDPYGSQFYPGWQAGRGGGGWWGAPGTCAVPQNSGSCGGQFGFGGPLGGGGPLGRGGPWEPHSYREQKLAWKHEKRAWKGEKRAVKREYRQTKRAVKYERRQRRREARAMRYHGGKSSHKRDHPWKLIITFHGAQS